MPPRPLRSLAAWAHRRRFLPLPADATMRRSPGASWAESMALRLPLPHRVLHLQWPRACVPNRDWAVALGARADRRSRALPGWLAGVRHTSALPERTAAGMPRTWSLPADRGRLRTPAIAPDDHPQRAEPRTFRERPAAPAAWILFSDWRPPLSIRRRLWAARNASPKQNDACRLPWRAFQVVAASSSGRPADSAGPADGRHWSNCAQVGRYYRQSPNARRLLLNAKSNRGSRLRGDSLPVAPRAAAACRRLRCGARARHWRA